MQGITNPSMMEMQAYEKMPLETIESFELIMDPTGPLNVAFAAMQSAMPNIDALLGRVVRGTNLLQGKPDDYALSLVMAMAFPLVQFALDRTVFDVSVTCSSAPFSVFCRAFVAQFQEVAVPLGFQHTRRAMTHHQKTCNSNDISLGDKKKGWQLVAHHIATVILIAYSYYLNVTRVGVMVLVCHEANDIFLEAANMARYAKVSEAISTGLFGTFLLSWFATGIYAFGFMVIRSALFESQEHFAEINVSIEPHWAILNGFLLFLSVLHIYWSCLIIQVAMRHGGSRPEIAKHAEPREYFINKARSIPLNVCCGLASAVAEES